MPQPTIRVLYVDDDAALVRLIQKTLGRRGFEVVHAATTEQALQALAGGGFDVIALDHFLASGTGLDFMATIGTGPDVPAIVYVTGSADTEIAVAALKAGAADYVAKAVNDDFLILLGSALEQAVEKSRLQAARDAAEQEVLIARDRAEVLLREVNHRVANSLSLVSSMVSMQSKRLTDPAAKAALAETQARIYAISLIHRRLYSSDDVRFVEIAEYLTTLVEHLALSLRGNGHDAQIVTEIDPLDIATDKAVSLGVVVTELVTNAIKYAYPHGTPGQVRVSLRRNGEEVALAVADDGIGWTGEGEIKGTGLGTTIIKAMATSLGTSVAYRSGVVGTAVELRFPLV